MIAKYKKSKWHHSLFGALLITLVAAFGLTQAQSPQQAETESSQQVAVETDIIEEFHPFPPDTKGLFFRFRDSDHHLWNMRSSYFSFDVGRLTSDDVTLKIAKPDDVYVFDHLQSLWRNERTNETFLELFLLGRDTESEQNVIFWLSGQYRTEAERLKALSQRNKVDQRHRGNVTLVKLTAGINESPNDDYTFDVETQQWRERTTGNLIPLEEFRELKNLEVRVEDTMVLVAAKALITWKNQGEAIIGLDLPQVWAPYHLEPPGAPSPFPEDAVIDSFYNSSSGRFQRSYLMSSDRQTGLLYPRQKARMKEFFQYVRLSPDDIFVFEDGKWRNETSGMTSPSTLVEGPDGIYLLRNWSVSITGRIEKVSINAETNQGIYSYRNGRWINLETGKFTTRETLEQEEGLKLSILVASHVASLDWPAAGTHIRLSKQGRKISVLDPRPESVPDSFFKQGNAPILAEDDVLIFADGKWKSEKTGEQWENHVFKSLWGSMICVFQQGIVKRLGWEEFGVSGSGKYIRLSDGGMTIETSDTPFE